MLTKTKLAIAVALLASSASGAFAQGLIGNGVPGERVQRGGPCYSVTHHKPAPRQVRCQARNDDVPFAPF